MRAVCRHQLFPVHQHPQVFEVDIPRRRLLVNLRQEFIERHLEQERAAVPVPEFDHLQHRDPLYRLTIRVRLPVARPMARAIFLIWPEVKPLPRSMCCGSF